jgi:hypothetical protein
VQLEPAEEATALRAAQVMGLEVAGVDLLRSKRGPLVLEVNSSPGLEGIEGITGVDVAGAIVEHVASRLPARRRGGSPARIAARSQASLARAAPAAAADGAGGPPAAPAGTPARGVRGSASPGREDHSERGRPPPNRRSAQRHK